MSHKIYFVPVLLTLLTPLAVSADDGAYDIPTEQSYLDIDPSAAPKDADMRRRGMEFAERLVKKGVDEKAMMEALTWLTSESYATQSLPKLRESKIPDEEIEYEILIDVLLRAGDKPKPHGGAPVRLNYRHKTLDSFMKKPNSQINSIASYYISDKQRLAWFAKMYKQDDPYASLMFSGRLVSERGKAEVIDKLLSIIGNFSGHSLQLAFKQADEFGADKLKLKALLEQQATKGNLMNRETFNFIVLRIMESETMTPTEKLKSLATMSGSKNGDAYKALGAWVMIYRKHAKSGKMGGTDLTFPTDNSEPITKMVEQLHAGKSMTRQLENFSDIEALALAYVSVTEQIINGNTITALYGRKWANDRNLSELAMLINMTKDKAMLGQAVADALPSLLASNIMDNYYLLEGAVSSQARVPVKHIPVLIAELEGKNTRRAMNHRSTLTLIGLLANSGVKDAGKHLHAMLDVKHPIYQDAQAEAIPQIRAWVIMHAGSLEPEEVEGFEKAITDALTLNASYYSSYGAARALRGWPADGKISNDLKKAIIIHLLSKEDQIMAKDMITGRFFNGDENLSSTTKQELLAFIEKGGKKRVQSFSGALEAMTKDNTEREIRRFGKDSKQWASELLESLN